MVEKNRLSIIMKRFDPSVFFIIFILFMLSGLLDAPILVFGIIGYIIYNMNKSKKRGGGGSGGGSDGRDYRRRNRNERRDYRSSRQEMEEDRRRRQEQMRRRQQPQVKKTPRPRPAKNNPYKNSGISKFKDYEYEAAIEDFRKALEIDAQDISVHFNIACAYSLTEEKEKSFFHLNKAVEYGFKDFERIKTHDALAYIRIQPEYDEFENNGFKLGASEVTKPTASPEENAKLLDQLKQLAELRERGLLTEEEFAMQKKKLLR